MQTLQGLQQAGQQLLLKTENGQFRLVTLGPPGTQLANNTAVAVASPGAGGTTTYRLATLPAGVSRLNAQFTGPPVATIRKPIQVTHT